MKITELNGLPPERAREALARCCGASGWVGAMVAARPFADARAVHAASERAAVSLTPADWREAFAHHPRIGDVAALRERFASTASWAKGEQRGAAGATDQVLEALARGNRAYEERFGYIFIVCATGKSAEEMLALLESRLDNDAERELSVAAGEQMKITRLRIDKLLEGSVSGLTTHVLDLGSGRPAKGVTVRLARRAADGSWTPVAERVTDADGRVKDFLGEVTLEAGRYLLTFHTGDYFRGRGEKSFHPEVPVHFEVSDPAQHHHVPLLLSAFGYSTYRGS